MLANGKLWLLAILAGTASAEMVRFKDRCLADVVTQTPALLASQDRTTGRFGKGIWIVNDQNVMLPLAAAWSFKNSRNPYYHDRAVLEAIMSGGDALIADLDKDGKWEFRKKDGSTWGQIYMPWTYSRWIRAYALIRDAMPSERRAKWERALRAGYAGIAKEVATGRIQNIPAHHAMGLYFAGQAFDNPEWRELASGYLYKVAEAQHPDGYWLEHQGPVVSYGFVYVDALGTNAAVSKDRRVLPALRKTAVFHSYFTYPDGSDVETVDERVPYHAGVRLPNTGFTFSPEGRSYLARQISRFKGHLPADDAASLLLWGEEGEGAGRDVTAADFDYVLGSGDAAVRRRGPWFLVVSAFTAPISTSRWIQDRQNLVSVYHDKSGLLIGGGNTKLQPEWSNFTAGDIGLFRHRAGDENPKFTPPAGVKHEPSAARLIWGDEFDVDLDYGGARGRIRLTAPDANRLEYTVSGDSSLTAHVTILPDMHEPVISASGKKVMLDAGRFMWSNADAGDWIGHRGARFQIPAGVMVHWPALPHNPYRKDGHGELDEARIVLDVPLSSGSRTFTVHAKP
jgi:hypothetical protein